MDGSCGRDSFDIPRLVTVRNRRTRIICKPTCITARPPAPDLRTVAEQSNDEIGADSTYDVTNWIRARQVFADENGHRQPRLHRNKGYFAVAELNVFPPIRQRMEVRTYSVLGDLILFELPPMMLFLGDLYVNVVSDFVFEERVDHFRGWATFVPAEVCAVVPTPETTNRLVVATAFVISLNSVSSIANSGKTIPSTCPTRCSASDKIDRTKSTEGPCFK